ncbi:MAG: GntR family transcriptional regulator [Rhodobacterales bacterium]
MPKAARQTHFLLANRILDLSRDARFEPGHHLREQLLADLLGVSRTPVRAALTLLSERGIVESRRNQGFFLRLRPDELSRLELDVPQSADQNLYAQIVQDRLSGALTDELTQVDLLRRYDVDRTVLQRTLSALVNDGLLAKGQGRSWEFMATLDNDTARDASFDFRRTIEPAGLLLTTFSADQGALDRLRLQHLHFESHPDIESLSSKQLFELDATVHETIAGFSRNAFFLHAVQHQNRLRRLLEFVTNANRRRVKEWLKEHLQIIEAINRNQRDTAARLLHDHLQNANAATAQRRKKMSWQ